MKTEIESIPQKLVLYIKKLMDANDGFSFFDIKEELDNHRLAAYGKIDMDLEAGRITPEKANEKKLLWDKLHSYR